MANNKYDPISGMVYSPIMKVVAGYWMFLIIFAALGKFLSKYGHYIDLAFKVTVLGLLVGVLLVGVFFGIRFYRDRRW